MLLTKTLTSSTFKLALIAIGTFGVIVSAIFSYVYLSTSSYVRSRSDRAIETEYASLRDAYARSGRDGLIDLIRQRVADKGFADQAYLLVDPSSAVLAGSFGIVLNNQNTAMTSRHGLLSPPATSLLGQAQLMLLRGRK